MGIEQRLKRILSWSVDNYNGTRPTRNLARHLGSLSPGGRCLVIGTSASFRKYASILKKHRHAIHFADVEREPLKFTHGFELVVVLGENIQQAHEFYSACHEFKAQGLPVVFGIDERALFYAPPDWKNANLSIAGMFYFAGTYLKGLPQKGAYCEFGVFDGRSFTLACHALKHVCTRFNAFDSFEGIAGTLENEETSFVDGAYYANLETFWHNLRVARVNDLPIECIKGNFQDTLAGTTASECSIEQINIVHIDSDIYEAAILALEFVKPALLDGALILFDEFNAFGANDGKGERRALKEWLENHPDISVEPYVNYTAKAKSFIVHKQ